MIIRSRGRDYSVGRRAAAEFGSSAIPAFPGGVASSAGVVVTGQAAVGLPAVASAISLVAETIASLDLNVFTGRRDRKRLADDAWQAELLADPSDDYSGFDLASDIAASIEVAGNAFIYKVRTSAGLVGSTRPAGTIVGLLCLDPSWVRCYIDRGQKVIQWQPGSGQEPLELSAAQVLHIRGFTFGSCPIGFSPIALHRQKLGQLIAADEYVGRFFSQGANSPGAIKVPGDIDQTEADRIAETYARRHMGMNQWHRPGVLINGADWVNTGMSLSDAQFVEGQNLGVQQVAQMWKVPASMIEAPGRGDETRSAEQEFLRFHMRMLPRLKRIEKALLHDGDLFGGRDPYPEFDRNELLRTDAKTQAEVRLRQVQSGQRVPDEVRADDGLPPLDEINPDLPKNIGKIPQVVPVGGSPAGVPLPGAEPAQGSDAQGVSR